jgi:hypothetical protein
MKRALEAFGLTAPLRQQCARNAMQKLAYVYFEDEPGRRSAAKLLTRDEARQIVSRIGFRRCSRLGL